MVRKPASIPDASTAESPVFWGLTRSESFDLATHVPVTRYGLRVLEATPDSEIKLWLESELRKAIRAEREGQFAILPDGGLMARGRRLSLAVEREHNNGSSQRHVYLDIVGERSTSIDTIAMRFANNVLSTSKTKLGKDIEDLFKIQRDQGSIFPDYPGYLRPSGDGKVEERGSGKPET